MPVIRSRQRIEAELNRLKDENARLRRENVSLRQEHGYDDQRKTGNSAKWQESLSINHTSDTEEKVKLFRSLFRGREDVYPIRWDNDRGRSGYSPACGNEWHKVLCGKPKVKCGQCKNSQFLPVTNLVIHDHLIGKQTIGVYPVLADGSCWLLAVRRNYVPQLVSAARYSRLR